MQFRTSARGSTTDTGAVQATQGMQGQRNAINGTAQPGQGGYSHPQQQQQQPSYQPYAMPGVGTSTALQHMANSPYASYAVPAGAYAQLPPPPPPASSSSSSTAAAAAAAATPAQQLRYNVPHPDPFNLLPLPSHQYAPIGMNYVPYPPPAPVIASQPPLATTVQLPASGPASTHVYSQLPPPPRGPSAADDPEALLPLPPSAFAGRSASMTSGADSAQGGLHGAQQDEDEDMPLRLPTPPSDLGGDDGDYQPQAGPSGSRKKRTGAAAHRHFPAKRARVSVPAAVAPAKGGVAANGDKKQLAVAQKKRGPNKVKPRLVKGEEPPPGLETTVDGSWRRKMSRGGWGGPGGTGGRPETFLRKLWK